MEQNGRFVVIAHPPDPTGRDPTLHHFSSQMNASTFDDAIFSYLEMKKMNPDPYVVKIYAVETIYTELNPFAK